MDKPLDGRVAIVTGGGTGIGRVIAITLASNGAKVVLAGRTESNLQRVETEIKTQGAVAVSIPTDLAEINQCEALISHTIERFGRLDILVNNATAMPKGGFKPSKELLDVSLDEWELALAVNVLAPFILSREAFPYLKKQDRGFIVNIGAIGTRFCYPDMGVYAATKNANRAMSIVLSKELRRHSNVRVHVVNPGGVATERFQEAIDNGVTRPDLQGAKMIPPQDIADAVLFLVTRNGNGMIDEVTVRREDADYYCFP